MRGFSVLLFGLGNSHAKKKINDNEMIHVGKELKKTSEYAFSVYDILCVIY